jgi:hypothetical protein
MCQSDGSANAQSKERGAGIGWRHHLLGVKERKEETEKIHEESVSKGGKRSAQVSLQH